MEVRRWTVLAILLLFVLSACRAVSGGLFDGAGVATSVPSSTSATKTLCESAADLRSEVNHLRSLEVSEDGLLTLLVSVDAALVEARTLAGLAGSVYAPLVTEVVVSLQDLRDIVGELTDQATIGAGIAAVGEAITAVGVSMESLGVQLREPCGEA